MKNQEFRKLLKVLSLLNSMGEMIHEASEISAEIIETIDKEGEKHPLKKYSLSIDNDISEVIGNISINYDIALENTQNFLRKLHEIKGEKNE